MAVVAVTGFMGSGKSAVGRAAAKRLGWGFVDLDQYVRTMAGRSIDEIFRKDGERGFRRLERTALEEVLTEAQHDAVVLSLGGGTLTLPESRELLRESAFVVYLDAPLDVCWDRVGGDPGRPLAASHAAFDELAAQRESSYRAAADVVIETGARDVWDLAREVAEVALALSEGSA